jgi:pyridoxine 5-phosphate synthase
VIRLGVNIDHIATIRQARLDPEPDPVAAAVICELAGAHQITVHLRGDRRHIQDRDLRLLRETVKSEINLEMGATAEMVRVALDVKPEHATLVPEKREEVTTEGGLDVVGQRAKIRRVVRKLKEGGITVSLFIDPDEDQVRASAKTGAEFIELHTGRYANVATDTEQDTEFEALRKSAELAHSLGLGVNAGHGLTNLNLERITTLPHLNEVNIGHNIIAKAVMVGLDLAVRDILHILEQAELRRDNPSLRL